MKILSLFSKQTFVCECLHLPQDLGYTRFLTANLGHSCFSKSPCFARPFLLIHRSPCCPSPVKFQQSILGWKRPTGIIEPNS